MTEQIYERLAEALDRLPNGFPRTPRNIEIRILEKIFSPGEALIASQLSEKLEPLDVIAKRTGLSVEDLRKTLTKMAEAGLVWVHESAFDPGYDFARLIKAKNPRFRLAPFTIGIFEGWFSNWDHELIHLWEQYMAEGGAIGIMKPEPSLHRVLPASSALKFEQILPYEDVRALLLNPKNKKFRVHDCYCRVTKDIQGTRRCEFPVEVCLSFSTLEHSSTPPDKKEITQKEALDILDHCEEIGLVHTVSNVANGINYVCNCCGCCCEILRGINEWGIEKSVATSNYYAVIDPQKCEGCWTCIDRCQVNAISQQNEVAVVNQKGCIGCGLCVTGCPNAAASLHRKPDAEIVRPPEDLAAWEHERLLNRELKE